MLEIKLGRFESYLAKTQSFKVALSEFNAGDLARLEGSSKLGDTLLNYWILCRQLILILGSRSVYVGSAAFKREKPDPLSLVFDGGDGGI